MEFDSFKESVYELYMATLKELLEAGASVTEAHQFSREVLQQTLMAYGSLKETE